MPSPIILSYIDMHTAGEPVRIVTGGYPALAGETMLAQRRDARENHDHLRRAMMLEPRGHDGMYGVIPVRPSHPGAVLGVLFTHNEGYSTMCGHATIALGRWVVEQGLVPMVEPVTRFTIEAPCGPLALSCTVENGAVTSRDVRERAGLRARARPRGRRAGARPDRHRHRLWRRVLRDPARRSRSGSISSTARSRTCSAAPAR